VVCSCGVGLGCFSYIPPTPEEWDEMVTSAPDYCPACLANGVESPKSAVGHEQVAQLDP